MQEYDSQLSALTFFVLIQGKTHVLSQPSALSNKEKSRIPEHANVKVANTVENQRSCNASPHKLTLTPVFFWALPHGMIFFIFLL
jgi:hypothetical protein